MGFGKTVNHVTWFDGSAEPGHTAVVVAAGLLVHQGCTGRGGTAAEAWSGAGARGTSGSCATACLLREGREGLREGREEGGALHPGAAGAGGCCCQTVVAAAGAGAVAGTLGFHTTEAETSGAV